MLILSRKKGQSILIGDSIEMWVTAIEGDQVKIGVKAPSDMRIFRKEIYESVEESNRAAVAQVSELSQLKEMICKEEA